MKHPIKLRYITPLLAAAGVAAAIVAAPTALAADTVCSSPGNVQINDSAPIQFGPQYPYWAGDYFGGYGYGGGHTGGHR